MSDTTPDAAASEELTRAALDSAFQGELGSSRLSWAYRVGLFLGAVVTMVLPLIYLALTAAAAYGTWMWLVHTRILLQNGFNGIIGYSVVALAGGFLVLFMIKPLFAQPVVRPLEFELEEENYPLLSHFIALVCRAVGAPAPRKVYITCDVNASASLRRGLSSFFGHDLTLTIGAPLLAGMSTRQVAGVLAHEFGHFSQGSAMRMSYLVRSINEWFARVVFQRDEWDQMLQSGDQYYVLELLKGLCRVMVWITRRILQGLMMVSHAIGMYLLRAMEYNADSYEARLAGSDAFGTTCNRVRILTAGFQRAIDISNLTVPEGKLCDDFPSLVQAMTDRFSDEFQQQILEAELPQGRFDTHPPNKARILAAQQMAAPGMFRIESPARLLIPEFEEFARKVTRIYYLNTANIKPGKISFVPLQEYLSLIDSETAYEKDANESLLEMISLRHLVFGSVEERGPFSSIEEGMATIRSMRQSIQEESATFFAEHKELEKALETTSPEDETFKQRFEVQDKRFGHLKRLLGRQIGYVAALLQTEGVERLFKSPEECERCRRLLAESFSVLKGITSHQELTSFMSSVEQGWDLVSRLQGERDSPEVQQLLGCIDKLRLILPRLQGSYHKVAYPFAENSNIETLRDYLCVGLPLFVNEPMPDLACASQFLERLSIVYTRCLSRVGHVVGVVEAAMAESPRRSPDAPADA